MKIIATGKSDQNEAAFDPWTLVHLSSGLAAGLMEIPLRWAFGASLAYEVAEQWVERLEWGQEFFVTVGPESLPNVAVDSLAFLAGYRLGQMWNRTR